MAITTVSTYSPIDKLPVALAVTAPDKLEINNQTTFKLTITTVNMRATVDPYSRVIFASLGNLVTALSNLLISPALQNTNRQRMPGVPDGQVSVVTYGGADPLPALGTYIAGSFAMADVLDVEYRIAASGPAPTLGALQAGVTAQALAATSTDQRGAVQLTYPGAGAPGVGAVVAIVTFAQPYAAVPFVYLNSNAVAGNPGSYGCSSITANGFSINTRTGATLNNVELVSYLVIP